MNHNIVPPLYPSTSKPIHPPMFYVRDTVKWENKLIVRNLGNEILLIEKDLNTLGKKCWELSGIAHQAKDTYYYFKRLAS